MAVQDLREQLKAKVDELSDDEAAAVLRYIQSMTPADIAHYIEVMNSHELPEDYDFENDPSVGMLSGPTDLSENVKQILRDEITARSGWTQKKD
jgi:hypothetical protein